MQRRAAIGRDAARLAHPLAQPSQGMQGNVHAAAGMCATCSHVSCACLDGAHASCACAVPYQFHRHNPVGIPVRNQNGHALHVLGHLARLLAHSPVNTVRVPRTHARTHACMHARNDACSTRTHSTRGGRHDRPALEETRSTAPPRPQGAFPFAEHTRLPAPDLARTHTRETKGCLDARRRG